jgi:hypothetical protein
VTGFLFLTVPDKSAYPPLLKFVITYLAIVLVTRLPAQSIQTAIHNKYVCSVHIALRKEPISDGIKTLVIPYGSRVEFQHDTLCMTTVWSKIKYGPREGYVAAGALSRYPPLMSNEVVTSRSEIVAQYLTTLFGKPSSAKSIDSDLPQEKQEVSYPNGTQVVVYRPSMVTNLHITFPDSVITFREMYLIARMIYPECTISSGCPYREDGMICHSTERTSLLLQKNGNQYILNWAQED